MHGTRWYPDMYLHGADFHSIVTDTMGFKKFYTSIRPRYAKNMSGQHPAVAPAPQHTQEPLLVLEERTFQHPVSTTRTASSQHRHPTPAPSTSTSPGTLSRKRTASSFLFEGTP